MRWSVDIQTFERQPPPSPHAMSLGISCPATRESLNQRQKRPEELTASSILLGRPPVLLHVIFFENIEMAVVSGADM